MTILSENSEVDRVADELVARSLIPATARVDALHLAIAAFAGVQHLLTLDVRSQIQAEHGDRLSGYLLHSEFERLTAPGRVGPEVKPSWPPPVES